MKTISVAPIVSQQNNLAFYPEFLETSTADYFYKVLLDQLAWSEETINMFGKTILVPRLVCWYGDANAIYNYSGVKHDPLPWISPLLELKARLETFTHHSFNSVLGNLYRNEKDSMGWHSDNEKELGDEPFIASVSLGEARIFRARHKTTKQQIKLTLTHGSLLTMSGNFQQLWQHSIPKCSTKKGGRINLTFRNIVNIN